MGVIMPQDEARSLLRDPRDRQVHEGENVADLTLGPLVCGTASVIDGTFVWTDYAYDDTGASEAELHGGAATYPEGLTNAADLIQLQIRPVGEGLHIRAVLQTLHDPALPVLAVA